MSEHHLIQACKQGEMWARKELYETYAPSMMSLCRRYMSNYNDAQDVLQEGFLKIFTVIGQYSGKGAFGAWIRKVFVNTALEHIRKRSRVNERELLNDYQMDFQDDYPDVEKVSEDDLVRCIAELPEMYRTIFNLFVVEGYKHMEIAEMLDIPESTSRSYFFRARKLLQEKVTRLINE